VDRNVCATLGKSSWGTKGEAKRKRAKNIQHANGSKEVKQRYPKRDESFDWRMLFAHSPLAPCKFAHLYPVQLPVFCRAERTWSFGC
jgi:hypothetical protein